MRDHWLKIVRDNDTRVDAFLQTVDRAPGSPSFGAAWLDGKYRDPKPTTMLVAAGIAACLAADSRYCADRRVVEAAEDGLAYVARSLHDDGTFDYTPVNFHSPPDTAFIVNRLVTAHDLLAARGTGETFGRLREAIMAIIRRTVPALATLRFHTPNHRWALAAALSSCHRLLGDGGCRAAADRLLVEGIDCSEDGEYAERSAGNYNCVTNEQMIVLAEAREDPGFLDFVCRNLRMMLTYVEPDGSLFTGNSTRQDRGAVAWLDQYWPHYYLVGRRLHREDFLATARRVMSALVEAGRQSPDCLDRLMLAGDGIDYGTADSPPLASYAKHYRQSGIVRLRRGEWSCSLVAGNGQFLHFQSGALRASLRLGVTFFHAREFTAATIEEQTGSWTMRRLIEGWYYLPFEQSPGTADWWSMDHCRRAKTRGPDLGFTVAVRERPEGDGIEVDAGITGCAGVPVRFEVSLPAGAQLDGDSFALEANAGGKMLVTAGLLRVRRGLDCMIIGPCFAEHRELAGLYGGELQTAALFTAHATAFTPLERTLVFRRAPWTDAEPVHERSRRLLSYR